MANTKDSLQAQADLLRARMELLAVQAQLMQYQYKDLGAQLERVNTQLAAATAPSQLDAPTEEMLAKIAKASTEELPHLITRVSQQPDGSWKQVVETKEGDVRELTVIERAILARMEELRANSGT